MHGFRLWFILVLSLCCAGCGRINARGWPSRLAIAADLRHPRGTPEKPVGLCERARGMVLHGPSPVVATCLEQAIELSVVGWSGRLLLLIRPSSGGPLLHARSIDDLREHVAPITTRAGALSFFFASMHLTRGRPLDLWHRPESLARAYEWEQVARIPPPSVTPRGQGWEILWPVIKVEGDFTHLYVVTTRIRRDGVVVHQRERLVARGHAINPVA